MCASLIYFENTHCVSCGTALGYLPILDNMSSIEFVESEVWRALAPQAQGALYKKCSNYQHENVCNWMVPNNTSDNFCIACGFNEIIPDLSIPQNRQYWHRLEIAKRRLIYSLLRLDLPLQNKKQDSTSGLAFSFMADEKMPILKETKQIMIGHDQGQITMNIAEANDVVREKMKLNMNERYRTLLGHFRHEIGHYYWFLCIENNNHILSQFRNIFGDERSDYNKTLKQYYANGAPADWQKRFVSAYASAHPWEDWAESWAHYLHMIDALETARAWGLTVNFKKVDAFDVTMQHNNLLTFEEMRTQWVQLSTALNSLNRSMGMADVYPFVWSETVIEKLRFIQEFIFQFRIQRGVGV